MLRRALSSFSGPLSRLAVAAGPVVPAAPICARVLGGPRPLLPWHTERRLAGEPLRTAAVGGNAAILLAQPLWRQPGGGVWGQGVGGARSMAAKKADKGKEEKKVDPNFNKKLQTGARKYRNLIELLQLLDEFGVGHRVARKNWIKYFPNTYWVVTRTLMNRARNHKAYGVLVVKGVARGKEIRIRGAAKRDWKYLEKVPGEAEQLAEEARLNKLKVEIAREDRKPRNEELRKEREAAQAEENARRARRPGQVVVNWDM